MKFRFSARFSFASVDAASGGDSRRVDGERRFVCVAMFGLSLRLRLGRRRGVERFACVFRLRRLRVERFRSADFGPSRPHLNLNDEFVIPFFKTTMSSISFSSHERTEQMLRMIRHPVSLMYLVSNSRSSASESNSSMSCGAYL